MYTSYFCGVLQKTLMYRLNMVGYNIFTENFEYELLMHGMYRNMDRYITSTVMEILKTSMNFWHVLHIYRYFPWILNLHMAVKVPFHRSLDILRLLLLLFFSYIFEILKYLSKQIIYYTFNSIKTLSFYALSLNRFYRWMMTVNSSNPKIFSIVQN